MHAIATAVYGGNLEGANDPERKRKMTWSVISGTTKDDMAVDRELGIITHTIHQESDICAALREFLQLVKGVIHMHQAAGHESQLPAVCGASHEIQAKGLIRSIAQSFRSELGDIATLADPAYAARFTRDHPDISEQVLHKESLKIMLKTLMQSIDPNRSIQYDTRDYSCAQGCDDWEVPANAIVLSGGDAQERTRLTNMIIPTDLRARFDSTYSLFLNGREDLRGDLEGIVREIAVLYATYGMVVRDEHGEVINRFISAATTPDLTSDSDVRNFIFLDLGLRRVYGEAFIAHHRIRHNVCLKTSLDNPSPPFADVAGTFLADIFDRRDGTQPTSVLVN